MLQSLQYLLSALMGRAKICIKICTHLTLNISTNRSAFVLITKKNNEEKLFQYGCQ